MVGGHDSNHTVTQENHRSIKLQFWTKVRGVIQVQTRRQLQVSEPLFCQISIGAPSGAGRRLRDTASGTLLCTPALCIMVKSKSVPRTLGQVVDVVGACHQVPEAVVVDEDCDMKPPDLG